MSTPTQKITMELAETHNLLKWYREAQELNVEIHYPFEHKPHVYTTAK